MRWICCNNFFKKKVVLNWSLFDSKILISQEWWAGLIWPWRYMKKESHLLTGLLWSLDFLWGLEDIIMAIPFPFWPPLFKRFDISSSSWSLPIRFSSNLILPCKASLIALAWFNFVGVPLERVFKWNSDLNWIYFKSFQKIMFLFGMCIELRYKCISAE